MLSAPDERLTYAIVPDAAQAIAGLPASPSTDMSSQTTFSAAALTGRGFLPAELPPVFSSETLGAAYANIANQIANALAPKGTRVVPTTFHLTRQGTLRRRLAIPHPLYYAQLCECVKRYSSELTAALARSS